MHSVVQFLDHHSIFSADQLPELAQAVSAIPWGEARDLKDVLAKCTGTCTGKHILLQACFDHLGIQYRPVVCTFRWQEQHLVLPENLQTILDSTSWLHGHNFIQVKLKNEWIDVDVTWDAPLEQFGFRSLPVDWNGQTNFIGLNVIVQRWNGVSIIDKKAEILSQLTDTERTARALFLDGLIHWIDSLRYKSK